MSQEDREVYLLHEEGEDGWVRPQPARSAILDALTEATALEGGAVGDLEEYVAQAALRDLLDGEADTTLSFEVEGHEVTVDSAGNVTIT